MNFDDSPVEQCRLTIVVILCATATKDDLLWIVERVRGTAPLSVEQFQQLMLDLQSKACIPAPETTIPLDALKVEPGTELATALAMELAPYLVTEEP